MSQGVFFKIVIPTYNDGDYIGICLDSIFQQECDDYFVVVCDDMSTDKTTDIVKNKIAGKEKRAVLLKSDYKGFSGHARNMGIDYKIDSQYTLFIDGDDFLIDKYALTTLKRFAISRNADMLSFGWKEFENDLMSNTKTWQNFKLNNVRMLARCGVAPWHHIVKSNLVARFPENLARRQDAVQILRQFDMIETTTTIKDPIYCYRVRHGQWRYYGDREPYNTNRDRPEYDFHVLRWFSEMTTLENTAKNEFIRKAAALRKSKFLIDYNAMLERNEEVNVCMSTFPPRKSSMLEVVKKLSKQCDHLYIWLNEYKAVPEELKQFKNVIPKLGKDKNYRENGRLYWLGKLPGYYISVDDDLNYPDDYVKKMIEGLKKYDNKVIVGFHGAVFNCENGKVVSRGYLDNYFRETKADKLVDRVGGGCLGAKPDEIGLVAPPESEFLWWDGDAFPAVWAKEHNVPIICLAKPRNWITALSKDSVDYTKVGALYLNKNTLNKRMSNYARTNKWKNIPDVFDVGKYLHNKLKICVISAADSKLANIYKYTNYMKRNYCKSNGYDFIFEEIKPSDGDSFKYRQNMIEKYLNDYDWVMWMDADAWFNMFSYRLEKLIEGAGPNINLIVARDQPNVKSISSWHDQYINSGVLLFRGKQGSEVSKKMIDLWRTPPKDAEAWMKKHTGLHDQPFLSIRVLFDSFYSGKVLIFPPERMNWFLSFGKPEDKFIVHAAGLRSSKKLEHDFYVYMYNFAVDENLDTNIVRSLRSILEKESNTRRPTVVKTIKNNDSRRNSDIFIPSGFELKPTLKKAPDYNKPFGLIEWN